LLTLRGLAQQLEVSSLVADGGGWTTDINVAQFNRPTLCSEAAGSAVVWIEASDAGVALSGQRLGRDGALRTRTLLGVVQSAPVSVRAQLVAGSDGLDTWVA